MIGRSSPRQGELFIAGSMESLIPDDYVLKRVDGVLDLSWLEEEVREVYSERLGRPSIPPERAVRLMLAGFLLGIVHDRALLREAQMHLGIRWFAGYSLEEALPDHSTLTRIRQRWGPERFRRILERTVKQCVSAGLVDASTLHVDATLVRADVSWSSLVAVHADEVWSKHAIDDGRGSEQPPKQKLPQWPKSDGSPPRKKPKRKKRSRTDPDASMATGHRGHRLEPTYKQHTTVEGRSGVVTDIVVTTGESGEGHQLLDQIERSEAVTGQRVKRVTADRGYSSGRNYEALEEREIDPVIAVHRTVQKKGRFALEQFRYDERHDVIRCPRKKLLRHRRSDERGDYYRADRGVCDRCALRRECLAPKKRARTVLLGEGHTALRRARRRCLRRDETYREAYRKHRWRVEGVHGQLKERHGMRRAVRRGLGNVAIQAYLASVAYNLKILAAARAAAEALAEALRSAYRATDRWQAQAEPARLSALAA